MMTGRLYIAGPVTALRGLCVAISRYQGPAGDPRSLFTLHHLPPQYVHRTAHPGRACRWYTLHWVTCMQDRSYTMRCVHNRIVLALSPTGWVTACSGNTRGVKTLPGVVCKGETSHTEPCSIYRNRITF